MIDLDKILAEFNGKAGVSVGEIHSIEDAFSTKFPDDYVSFMSATNGGEGEIGDTYVMLWSIEELMEFNKSYQVDELAPGLLLIGSDGSGEAFAFDTRTNPWQMVQVPFVGMSLDDVEVLAPSFELFLDGLAK